jgi:hypothetical protein
MDFQSCFPAEISLMVAVLGADVSGQPTRPATMIVPF